MHPAVVVRSLLLLSWTLECWASNGALVISPSEYFEGNDGPWSSFFIRVGTPAQDVRVLVSTASPETLVVLSPYGCSTSVFATVPANCAVSRGVLFNPNQSSTWHDVGTYGINQNGVGLEANLGYSERANFALETLGIDLTGPSLSNQTVGGIATASPFYLGIFGLNNQPVNFSSLGNYSSPSFLTTLKDQGAIPSLSWSYTAGAKYRLKEVYGQLIFSGYDTSRFAQNPVSFTMAGDLTRDLVVALQSISYSGTTQATLLSEPINIFIDSTDPNLWLPGSACDAFEQAFGLTLDTTTGLYLINDTHHSALLNTDAQVSFVLSDVQSGGATVTITLPYSAFDLTAGYPLVANTSYYFPLKRAANSTQYTLGRTFLQEAYLTADYERGVFNVSACTWVEGATPNVVTITSADSGTSGGLGSSSAPLSGGAIAGIVVGCVAFAAILGAVIAFCLRRRKAAKYAATDPEPDDSVINGPVFNPGYPSPFGAEPKLPSQEQSQGSPATGEAIASEHGNELDAQDTNVRPTTELDGNEIQSLHGQPAQVQRGASVYELGGREVGPTERDDVSTLGTLPSHDDRDEGEGPSSPMVSTLGADRGEAFWDLVPPSAPFHHGFSPTSPTHHGFSPNTPAHDKSYSS